MHIVKARTKCCFDRWSFHCHPKDFHSSGSILDSYPYDVRGGPAGPRQHFIKQVFNHRTQAILLRHTPTIPSLPQNEAGHNRVTVTLIPGIWVPE